MSPDLHSGFQRRYSNDSKSSVYSVRSRPSSDSTPAHAPAVLVQSYVAAVDPPFLLQNVHTNPADILPLLKAACDGGPPTHDDEDVDCDLDDSAISIDSMRVFNGSSIAEPHLFEPGNNCLDSNLSFPDHPASDPDFQTRTKSGLRRRYLETSGRDNLLNKYRKVSDQTSTAIKDGESRPDRPALRRMEGFTTLGIEPAVDSSSSSDTSHKRIKTGIHRSHLHASSRENFLRRQAAMDQENRESRRRPILAEDEDSHSDQN